MNYRILFKYPSRSRPIKFFEGLDSIIKNIADKENYHILCSFDADDLTMNNGGIIEKLRTYDKLSFVFGNSKTKIQAVNNDMGVSGDWDICIVMSDDMRFLVSGFDDIVRKDMEENFPDIDGVLHYPDSHTKEKLITLSILGKKYYDSFGYLYHPDYCNVYCDQEFTNVAKILRRYKFIDKIIFDHFHPIWGMAEMDDQYRKTENKVGYMIDKATYNRRQAINFGI